MRYIDRAVTQSIYRGHRMALYFVHSPNHFTATRTLSICIVCISFNGYLVVGLVLEYACVRHVTGGRCLMIRAMGIDVCMTMQGVRILTSFGDQ